MTRHDELVQLTVSAGVPPLALRYCAIRDCSAKAPFAYRTSTAVNSILLGRLTPHEYAFAADRSEIGVRLAEWNIRQAIREARRFAAAGRHISFLAVRCSALLAAKEDLYERIGKILTEESCETPSELCLEFPQSLLFPDNPEIRKSVLDMKLLGVRTMMSGCAAKDCPLSKLTEIPVDMVVLDPGMTALTNDRDKPRVVPSLVQYLRSMRLDVIAEGVLDDEQVRSLSRLDCLGYIPSRDYAGTAEYSSPVMPVEEALLQKEADA